MGGWSAAVGGRTGAIGGWSGAIGGWSGAVGGWTAAVGGWTAAVCGWTAAVGGWTAAVGGWTAAVGGWAAAVGQWAADVVRCIGLVGGFRKQCLLEAGELWHLWECVRLRRRVRRGLRAGGRADVARASFCGVFVWILRRDFFAGGLGGRRREHSSQHGFEDRARRRRLPPVAVASHPFISSPLDFPAAVGRRTLSLGPLRACGAPELLQCSSARLCVVAPCLHSLPVGGGTGTICRHPHGSPQLLGQRA